MQTARKISWIGTTLLLGLCSLRLVAQQAPRAHLTVQLGHSHGVLSVAFSPDGRYLLSGSADNTVLLWDAGSGLELRRFTGHTGNVTAAAFSSDGQTVLSASWDSTARLWDVKTGRERQRFTETSMIYSAAFSPDGHAVVLACGDGAAHLIDLSTDKEVQRFAAAATPPQPVTSVAFSADGRRLVTGGWDKTARLWDAATGKELQRFEGHAGWITSVAISRDGKWVLTGSQDGTARFWDANSGKELLTIKPYGLSVESVAISADASKALIADYYGSLGLWDLKAGKLLLKMTPEGNPGEYVDERALTSVALSPDGRKAITGSQDKTVRLWDLDTGKELRRYEGNSSWVYSAAFSPNGREIVTASEDAAAHLWDEEAGQQILDLVGHTRAVRAAVFSRDGRSLLTGSQDGTARLWDISAGKQTQLFGIPLQGMDVATAVYTLDLSPDGKTAVTAGFENFARLWDVATGKEIRRFQGHTAAILSVEFSPDGRELVTGSADKTVRVWDVATGNELASFNPSYSVLSVAFSPDGQSVFAGGQGFAVNQWNVKTGNLIRSFTGSSLVMSLALSADGSKLVTANWEDATLAWDLASSQQLQKFKSEIEEATSASFSPDGRFVLTSSGDGTARLWDAASGGQLASLISFQNGGWAVVDPEGRFDTNDLDGGAPLHWIVDDEPMKALPLEIFMRDYYTPRLLTSIMNGETLPPTQPISEIANRVQPDVSIVSVMASKTHPGRADVVVHLASRTEPKHDPNGVPLRDARGKVVTQASGLADLRLFRNGQLVGIKPGALKDGDFRFSDIQLPTSAQSVIFTAYAFNSERIKSPTAAKDYAYNPGPPARPRAWLLQIGVNHYQASNCDLHGSANDAEKLSQVLSDRLAARGLEVRAVTLVSTGQTNDATKEKIRSALAAIAAAATPDDVFFLSFSGHGYTNPKGEFYILPSDAQGTCAGVDDRMLKTSISADELAAWLQPIDAGQMTFILDSCDSAGSVESPGFKPGPMGSRGLGQLAYDKRMRILAASQPNQAARESATLGQGLLSYALTEQGLLEGKADWKPADGKIMVGEWLNYAANAVPEILKSGAVKTARGVYAVGQPEQEVKSAQTPAVFDFSKSDTFVLQ